MHLARQITFSAVCFITLIAVSASGAEGVFTISAEKENEQLAILRSDSPLAEKALACKRLAIDGSSAAVPDLAKLLPDAQLSSWARIALEAIPGPSADEALRTATSSLKGDLLIGTINSIGVRRDGEAVELLTERLQGADAGVASAAAVALGRIGNAAAAASLRKLLASAPVNVRSAVAEGCVLCAERFHSEGKSAEAAELYDEVRKADVPKQRVIEATRGAILARKQDGIPLLLEQFRSSDNAFFQLALGTAREFPGAELDTALAEEMVAATPEHAALMIQSMADRKETVVMAAIMKAAEQGPMPVRLSAINALARVGDVSCLPSLLKIAIESNSDLAQTARTTLAELPGDNVDAQIVSLLPKSEGAMVPLLVELVAKRRIDAVSDLLKMLNSSDPAIRSTALTALGETIKLDQLSVLVSQVVGPKFPEDQAVAQRALTAASIRMPDREACAAELAAAVANSKSTPTKIALLQTLAAVGGTNALAAVGSAASGANPQLQDASSRLLGEWMTEDVAPVLLDLAKSPSNPYHVRAMRGYIRVARQFVLPEDQRFEMCQKAYDASRQSAEKKLVLDVLKRYPSMDSLTLAIKAMKVPDLKEDATQATLVIAQKLGSSGVDLTGILSQAGFERVKVEIVKAEYGAGSIQKDVTAVLQKHVSDLPLITLPSASYNTNFGGDPAQGSVKNLKIQYRINGKPAEVSLAEDAFIILPVPKQ
jgi:HEAT repeat protein